MESTNSETWVIKWSYVLKRVLLNPKAFFGGYQAGSSPYVGLIFGILLGSVGLLLNLIFEFGILTAFLGSALQDNDTLQILLATFGANPTDVAALLAAQSKAYVLQKLLIGFFSPVILFFFANLFASAVYFSLRGILSQKDNKLGYNDFLGMIGFAQAPFLFAFIPFVGPIIAFIWMLSLVVVLLKPYLKLGTFFRVSIVLMPAMMIYVLWSSAIGILTLNISKDLVKTPFNESVLLENLEKSMPSMPNN